MTKQERRINYQDLIDAQEEHIGRLKAKRADTVFEVHFPSEIEIIDERIEDAYKFRTILLERFKQ